MDAKRRVNSFAALLVAAQHVAKLQAAVVLAVVLALGCVMNGCAGSAVTANNSSASQSDDAAFSSLVNDKQAQGVPSSHKSKIAGSQETVDAEGIVHGVTADGIRYTVLGRGQSGASSDKVTLCAVGDQIGTDSNLPWGRKYGARIGQEYDFTPFYQEVSQYIQAADLRYINQETVMAGDDYSGYPMFNSPDAMAQTISNVGFNLVNFCSNHIYDRGTEGVELSHQVWARYTQILLGGSYLTMEDRQTVHMIERNGMTFALLGYTYADNNYGTAAGMPNQYYVCGFDKDAIAEDVRCAQAVADVVIVSMHWGDEYTAELNDQQLDYAQFLADLDVDLVLGSHAHNMQPFRYVTGSTGNTIPVMFGLSDFVSGWTLALTELSGLFTCDFVWDGDEVAVENIVWYPCIEWSDGGDLYVRRLVDMDQETCDSNNRIIDVSGSYYEYLRDYVNSVGMECKVVM